MKPVIPEVVNYFRLPRPVMEALEHLSACRMFCCHDDKWAIVSFRFPCDIKPFTFIVVLHMILNTGNTARLDASDDIRAAEIVEAFRSRQALTGTAILKSPTLLAESTFKDMFCSCVMFACLSSA